MTTETAKPGVEHLIEPGDTPFGYDAYLGRTLKPDQDFIGPQDFMSFSAAVAEIRAQGKPVILNVGDSSTAGWDTRVTVVNKQRKANNQPLLSAFFHYPTYSDLLRDTLGDDYVVLNAGIPGHTSLNTRRRLRDLLERFREQQIRIDYVSIYCGNNDCQWEFNVEDKSKLRTSRAMPLFIDRLLLKLQKPDTRRIRLRTNSRDFGRNVRGMIETCRAHDAAPIVIVPAVPLSWEPGKRFVAEQFPVDESMPGGVMVLAALKRAAENWEAGMQSAAGDERLARLEAAKETDFVVPRLKRHYRTVLESVARDSDTPLVRIDIPRDENETAYFIDYCHPVGPANEAIASGLATTVADYAEGRIKRSAQRASLFYRVLDSRWLELILRPFGGSRHARPDTDPTNQDIYTLY